MCQLRQAQVLGDNRGDGTGTTIGGLIARDDQFDTLDLAQRAGQHPGGLHGVGAADRRIVDVDGLVGTHGKRLADGLGGPVRTGGQHGDLTALGLLDQQRFFDGALVDLVEDGVGGLAIEGEITVGQLALGPSVGNLLDEYDDVRHRCSSTSCSGYTGGVVARARPYVLSW